MDQDGIWHRGGPRSRPQYARWGPSYPPYKGGLTAHFRPISIVAKRLMHGVEVGLSRGNFLFDGDQAPAPKKGVEPPVFGPCLLWPNGWMDQDAI